MVSGGQVQFMRRLSDKSKLSEAVIGGYEGNVVGSKGIIKVLESTKPGWLSGFQHKGHQASEGLKSWPKTLCGPNIRALELLLIPNGKTRPRGGVDSKAREFDLLGRQKGVRQWVAGRWNSFELGSLWSRGIEIMTMRKTLTQSSDLTIEHVASTSTLEFDEDGGDGRPRQRMRVQRLVQEHIVTRTARAQLRSEQGDEGSEKSGRRVGAHVSAAGCVENAPVNAADIGYDLSPIHSFSSAYAVVFNVVQVLGSMLFLTVRVVPQVTIRGPRSRKVPRQSRQLARIQTESVLRMLPGRDSAMWAATCYAAKHPLSYLLDTLRLGDEKLADAHSHSPGSIVSLTTLSNSCALIAECINEAHRDTAEGAGNVIRSNFEEIALNIEGVGDKTPVGVCFDTLRKFRELIVVKSVKGMHLDDSKTEFGSKTDRHESIGMGSLSLASFHHILSNARTKGISLVLETPSWECPKEICGTEIEVLRKFIGLPVLTEAKTVEGELVAEEKEVLPVESLQDEVKAAIKRVGGDQPKVKKGKGKVEGDSTTKVKAAKGKKGGAGKKRKWSLEDDDDNESDGAEEEGDEWSQKYLVLLRIQCAANGLPDVL
ncbi:xylose isomerase-like protein [Coprinopsis sp. MPI-PUGE-AT-0042]|nr:xylose isomerase-like protein [Coprinopsis sp. MPI-PUGE-AT-0042]